MVQKVVSFSSSVDFRQTMTISDYSHDERKAYWYSPEELDSIKTDIRIAVLRIESGAVKPNDHRVCMRGLESFTESGAARKQFFRKQCRDAVLNEQKNQRELKSSSNSESYLCSETIAKIYFVKSCKSRAIAKQRAEADEEWVRCNYLCSERMSKPTHVSIMDRPTNGGLCFDMKPNRVSSVAA